MSHYCLRIQLQDLDYSERRILKHDCLRVESFLSRVVKSSLFFYPRGGGVTTTFASAFLHSVSGPFSMQFNVTEAPSKLNIQQPTRDWTEIDQEF